MSEHSVPLNDCGCCEGVEPQTPLLIANAPSLNAVAYRVGTHSQFRASLTADLSSHKFRGAKGLLTREERDFSIALVDAWAMVADVLAFYQERRANEHFLRTANERWSIRELARLIGYRLKPGVAASTYLAFTLEESPGAPEEAVKTTIVPVGTKVQSIPGPGEQPQIFETIQEIVARPQWNAIRPRLTRRHPIESDPSELLFDGLSTNLKQGDTLLLQPDQQNNTAVLKWIQEVTLETKEQRTRVRLVPDLRKEVVLSPGSAASIWPRMHIRHRSTFFKPFAEPVDSMSLSFRGQAMGIASDDIFANLKVSKPAPPSVSVFRTKAAVFGHNAPQWENLSDIQIFGRDESFPELSRNPSPVTPISSVGSVADRLFGKTGLYGDRRNSWAEESLKAYQKQWNFPNGTVMLDRVYSEIVKGSWIVLQDGDTCHLYHAKAALETSFADFTLSAKCTRLSLDHASGFENCTIRGTTVFAGSATLPLARQPLTSPILGDTIDLDGFIEGLYEGQSILVRGEDDSFHGRTVCEWTKIQKVEVLTGDDGFVTITVEPALTHRFIRETVTIFGNVAPATHGETVTEALGGGDASQAYQRFRLRQPPVTYVSAATPGGRESTLRVFVNDQQWHEASSFFGADPTDHLFVVTHTEEGQAICQAGDGKTGSRFPSGLDNVRVVYRKGVGRDGNVKAGQLSMLLTRPLGVKDAKNYTPAVGGDDGERIEDARCNAPFTVKTLDRVVSLQDYEDFSLTFAGIAKALAVWTWDGISEGVFLTVSGPDGVAVDPAGTLGQNLLDALRKAGDPHVLITMASYRPAFFELRPRVKLDPDREPDRVLAAAEFNLRQAFSFDARSFGQPVTLSEIVTVLQSTTGVVAVDVDSFFRVPSIPLLGDSLLPERLFAEIPFSRVATPEPAELLLLSDRRVNFSSMNG